MAVIYKVHRYVSLICALFFLLLVLTGLLLLFRHEINAWNTTNLPARSGPMEMDAIWSALPAGMDAVAASAPGKRIRAVTPDPSDGTLYFRVENLSGGKKERAHMRMGGEQILYDVRSKTTFNRTKRTYRIPMLQTLLHEAHLLHVQMKMGSAGRDFLAAMCVLTLVSILTGLWLYAPMMKTLPFGRRRSNSTRLLVSDWHKIVSVITCAWAFLLTLSGILIVCYAMGNAQYHRDAPRAAANALAKQAAIAEGAHAQCTPAESLSIIRGNFPGKTVISMELPKDESAPYVFYLADPPAKATNFMLGEMAFLPQTKNAVPVFVPAPFWMHFAPFFLNLHIHSHDLFAEKLVWALLILGTAAMTATGAWLYATRWRRWQNQVRPQRAPAARAAARKTSPWREIIWFAAWTFLMLVPPLYGGAGDMAGLAASLILLFSAAYCIRNES